VKKALEEQEQAHLERSASLTAPDADIDPFEELGLQRPEGFPPEADQLFRKAWGNPRVH
jgi:hypothetical protein